MARQAFPYTTFTEANGNVLSFGYVLIYLVTDGQAPDGQICRGSTLNVPLDTNGVMTSVPQVWPNTTILPAGSYYVMKSYTASGELVSGPTKVTV